MKALEIKTPRQTNVLVDESSAIEALEGAGYKVEKAPRKAQRGLCCIKSNGEDRGISVAEITWVGQGRVDVPHCTTGWSYKDLRCLRDCCTKYLKMIGEEE